MKKAKKLTLSPTTKMKITEIVNGTGGPSACPVAQDNVPTLALNEARFIGSNIDATNEPALRGFYF